MLALCRAGYRVGHATLVAEADLEVRHGAMTALVGPNGAGKSTLLRLLSGEIAPSSGRAELDGAPLADFRPAALAMRRTVLPQHTVASFGFDALAIVLMGRHAHGAHHADEIEANGALAVMEELGVAHLARRDIRTLSGGEQQRVHLARALWQVRALPKGYLLLDEPTSSLDIAHQFDALAIARAEARRGAGVLVVLHDLNLAARFADTMAVVQDGRIVARGRPGEVLHPEGIRAWFGVEAMIHADPADGTATVLFRGRG